MALLPGGGLTNFVLELIKFVRRENGVIRRQRHTLTQRQMEVGDDVVLVTSGKLDESAWTLLSTPNKIRNSSK